MGIGFPRFSPEGTVWITWWDGPASRMQARSSSRHHPTIYGNYRDSNKVPK
jgi:hypothetical protein